MTAFLSTAVLIEYRAVASADIIIASRDALNQADLVASVNG